MSETGGTGATPHAAPSAPQTIGSVPVSPLQAIDNWERSIWKMTALLRETEPDAAWIESLDEATQHIRRLAKRDPDTALYLLLQKAAGETDHYSARHAMVCAIVCELCAAWLEWPPEEIDALAHAALTMNLAMSAIQDALVWQSGPLSEAQRQEVGKHAAASAALLAKAGVSDALWLDVIRQHHSAANGVGGQPMPAAQRLAQLLHRVDIYTAKLSRRASRDATTPSIAARDACLDQAGIPDATGATILRVLGLYPPGSFVLLANGEVGVVVRRGVKAHTPTVALVRRANGGTYTEPMRRDTTDSQHAVVRGMAVGDIKVRLNHERVLSAT